MTGGDRSSIPRIPDLIEEPHARAEREAKNGLRQFDMAVQAIDAALDPERPFKLRPSLAQGLNRIALDGINSYAGNYRPSSVEIQGSIHVPPDAWKVPELVEDMCEFVNTNWESLSAD